jgi:hypothetical protein
MFSPAKLFNNTMVAAKAPRPKEYATLKLVYHQPNKLQMRQLKV